jgi:hypothetical protein
MRRLCSVRLSTSGAAPENCVTPNFSKGFPVNVRTADDDLSGREDSPISDAVSKGLGVHRRSQILSPVKGKPVAIIVRASNSHHAFSMDENLRKTCALSADVMLA